MLILTGQFEAAIEFLYRVGKYKVHAVHIAIALHELGLLADPPSIWAALSESNRQHQIILRLLPFFLFNKLFMLKFFSFFLSERKRRR